MLRDPTFATATSAFSPPRDFIRESLAGAPRPGGTRWAEIWLSSLMTSLGAVLLAPGEGPPVDPAAPAGNIGAVALLVGASRLLSLVFDGCRPSPLIRAGGSAVAFLLYPLFAAQLLLAAPPLAIGLLCLVLAAAELHASDRSARDAVALDSLGTRRRRRARHASP